MAELMATLGDSISDGTVSIFTGPFGSALHSYDYVDEGIPVVPTEAIISGRLNSTFFPKIRREKARELRRYELRQGDLVFARRGAQACGLSAMVDSECDRAIAGTGTIVARINNPTRIDPVFFSYLIGAPSSVAWLKLHAIGATMPNLNSSIVASLPVSFPSFAKQKAIAEVLGTLDDKIELNRRMNATLEAMTRALFQSWFVDFDPATAALFPEHLEDSQLGHIPKGWEVCSLANKIELLSGGTPKTSEPDYWDGNIAWYSVKDAPSESDVWVIQTEKQVTKLGIESSAAQILPEGTTIISARGTVGKLALVGTPMAMNQSCYGVRGVEGYADYFTYFALRQATADLQQRTHGTVFDTITRQTFETLDCIFPPAPLTQAFDRTVAPLLAQIRANLHKSRTLATLRDTLLPKLLSGEIARPKWI